VKSPFLSLLAAVLSLVPFSYAGAVNRLPSVNKVSVIADNPLQIRIETSAPAAPQAQMIEQPDRLVIDLPNTKPGEALRRINVNRGAVKSVRASLYSAHPPVTRIVVDLSLPQWYRIVPDASGVVVTIGGGEGAAADPGNTIGWVSTKSPARSTSSARMTSVTIKTAAHVQRAAPVNGVSVDFTDGMLTIHASNATLSEVLFQIQKKTGAEIAIPAGTEQYRVAEDFGPAKPSEVIAQLLNGTGLNFVVVGSESDPNKLRSVLLSRKGPDSGAPVMEAQPYTPPVAQNTARDPADPGAVAVPGPEVQQQQVPDNMQSPQDVPPPS
jgi:AMIN domain